MAVIIKSMKMPVYCEMCPLCRYYPENGNIWCNILNRILRKQNWIVDYHTVMNIERPSDCPLVEVQND